MDTRNETDRDQIAEIIQRGHIEKWTSYETAERVLAYVNECLQVKGVAAPKNPTVAQIEEAKERAVANKDHAGGEWLAKLVAHIRDESGAGPHGELLSEIRD